MPAVDTKYPMPENRQTKIWRYISLSTFAAMLELQGVWFSSPLKFDDAFEGTFPLKPVTPQTSAVARHPLFTEATAKAFEKSPRAIMSSSFVSCWFMGEHESAALWKIYGSGKESLAIQTTIEKLVKLAETRVMVGMVTYIDYLQEDFNSDNLFNLLFHKRKTFEHEKEFRAVIVDPSKRGLPGLIHEFDLSKLIESIVVAPGASEHFKSFIQKVLKVYELGSILKPSEIDLMPAISPVYNLNLNKLSTPAIEI